MAKITEKKEGEMLSILQDITTGKKHARSFCFMKNVQHIMKLVLKSELMKQPTIQAQLGESKKPGAIVDREMLLKPAYLLWFFYLGKVWL